jgi:hypothetical protein
MVTSSEKTCPFDFLIPVGCFTIVNHMRRAKFFGDLELLIGRRCYYSLNIHEQSASNIQDWMILNELLRQQPAQFAVQRQIHPRFPEKVQFGRG